MWFGVVVVVVVVVVVMMGYYTFYFRPQNLLLEFRVLLSFTEKEKVVFSVPLTYVCT